MDIYDRLFSDVVSKETYDDLQNEFYLRNHLQKQEVESLKFALGDLSEKLEEYEGRLEKKVYVVVTKKGDRLKITGDKIKNNTIGLNGEYVAWFDDIDYWFIEND